MCQNFQIFRHVRAGIFGNFDTFVAIEMLVLVTLSLTLFSIATKLLAKLEL
jgi:hypothetical protein